MINLPHVHFITTAFDARSKRKYREPRRNRDRKAADKE